MSVLKTYGLDGIDDYHPSLTYKLNGNHIQGTIDGIEAVAQAVKLLLSTERFDYDIYSADYGFESKELVGARREFVQGDMQRRVEEVLGEDDRVTGISDFDLSFSGETCTATFTVNTIFGDYSESKEVTVNGG